MGFQTTRNALYLTPSEGETLEFTAGATISGVLDKNEIYRLQCDADCWVELDDGYGQMQGADSSAMLLTNDSDLLIRTTNGRYVLHAIGNTTSGLLNYIRMDQ